MFTPKLFGEAAEPPGAPCRSWEESCASARREGQGVGLRDGGRGGSGSCWRSLPRVLGVLGAFGECFQVRLHLSVIDIGQKGLRCDAMRFMSRRASPAHPERLHHFRTWVPRFAESYGVPVLYSLPWRDEACRQRCVECMASPFDSSIWVVVGAWDF